MKLPSMVACGAFLLFGFSVAQAQNAPAPNAVDPKLAGDISYSVGQNVGMSLKRDGVLPTDVDAQAFIKGLLDALTGAQPALTDEQRQAAFTALNQMLLTRKAGDQVAYLAKNKVREGVKTTASGLQYEVLKSGTGKTPKATDTVTTHYTGTLIDGTKFDSSVDRGEPASFPVGGVIKGWTEALQLMKVGDKWRLVIPSNLAYGENGTPGGPIGPNATLVFEIELLGIQGQ